MPEYTVTGPHAVLGHDPGKTFEADLPADQEKFLLAAGHLEKGKRAARPPVNPLKGLSRDELNKLARAEAGVPQPERLPNDQAVIDAIEAARNQNKEGR